MKKLLKYITGFVSFIIGMLVLSNKKNKKVNEIKDKIKDVDREIRKVKGKGDNLKKTLESKKEALKQIEKTQFKKKDVSVKDASNFLKNYAKGRK